MPAIDLISRPDPVSGFPARRAVLETAAQMHKRSAVEWREKASQAGDLYSGGKAMEMAVRHEKRAEALMTGLRGGRYYVSPTGGKVYISGNPGARMVGYMAQQVFYQGLPASVHLAEPKRR